MSAAGAAPRKAWLIATGDELIEGRTQDTNSGWLARALLELGIEVERMHVLGDDEDGLAQLVQLGAREVDLMLVTGGLGPTLDDVTRHALARAAGVELEYDEEIALGIQRWFESRGRAFAQSNRRQALFPAGAVRLANPIGTAAGFLMQIGRAQVAALPGPPRELEAIWQGELRGLLSERLELDATRLSRSYFLFGLPESSFADQCGAWMDRSENPLLGVTAKAGVLSAVLVARGADAHARLAARCEEFEARFASHIFSSSSSDLAQALFERLLPQRIGFSVAESCTGGLVAAKLTGIPGVSAVFAKGFVTYSNAAKTEELGVPPGLLAQHGAVSCAVAEAMALGAARRAQARLAVAITGIAGPDGGSAEKPVGMVCFATVLDGVVQSEERRFTVRGRDLIREFAAQTALDLVRRRLERR
ncbi:MAG: CinA family nicotinamide mononucleotide deamidase-related protein [Planctomycetia bacterium]